MLNWYKHCTSCYVAKCNLRIVKHETVLDSGLPSFITYVGQSLGICRALVILQHFHWGQSFHSYCPQLSVTSVGFAPPPLPSAAGCPLVSLYKTLHWDFQCNSAWWLPLTGLSNSVRSHGWKIHILNWALTSHTPKLDNIAIRIYDLKKYLSKNFFKMLLLS